MENSLQKQELNFRQEINRFIAYGIVFYMLYSFFYAPFAFFVLLPILFWIISEPLQISFNYFYIKEKNISLFEGFTLIFLFASIYVIYLVLLQCAGIDFLYYASNSMKKIDMFTMLISAPIVEEIIFRGFGIGIFKKYGIDFAIFATTLFFALLHIGIRVVIVLPSALMYGVIMVLTKNILFPIFI